MVTHLPLISNCSISEIHLLLIFQLSQIDPSLLMLQKHFLVNGWNIYATLLYSFTNSDGIELATNGFLPLIFEFSLRNKIAKNRNLKFWNFAHWAGFLGVGPYAHKCWHAWITIRTPTPTDRRSLSSALRFLFTCERWLRNVKRILPICLVRPIYVRIYSRLRFQHNKN